MNNTQTESRKRTLTATTPHGVFTRTTGHRYTHVVVTGAESITYLQTQIALYTKRVADRNWSGDRTWLAGLNDRLLRAQERAAAGVVSGTSWHHSEKHAIARAREEAAKLIVLGMYPVDDTTDPVATAAVQERWERFKTSEQPKGVR
jgi:hypothetical protein